MGFSSLPPLAGRNHQSRLQLQRIQISTHTPLAGCDLYSHTLYVPAPHFYSHVPRGT